MAARVRIGVVGLGYWGPNLVRNLADLDCVRDRLRLRQASGCPRAVRAPLPMASSTTQFHELLADDDVDAVAIATPVSTHYALAKAALEAGKHVFVEKPLAASSRRGARVDGARRGARPGVDAGTHIPLQPAVRTIKHLIDDGELGDIYFISSSRVNLGLHQPDVSVVWDLGPHDFSILRYWLGALPAEVSALSRSCVIPRRPRCRFINMRYPSGTLAHVELSWLAPSKLRRTAIVGSKKMVVYDDTATSR